MKNSQTIISNILKLPTFTKLKQQNEIAKLKITLPLSIKNSLLFVIPRNHQLLFAFKNQVICNEFNRYHTKKLLDFIQNNSTLFPSLLQVSGVKGYVPHQYLNFHFQTQKIFIAPAYPERSFGIFTNHCEPNSNLFKLFEEIRSIIINRHD